MSKYIISGKTQGVDFYIRLSGSGDHIRYTLMNSDLKIAVAKEKGTTLPDTAHIKARIAEFLEHNALEWT